MINLIKTSGCINTRIYKVRILKIGLKLIVDCALARNKKARNKHAIALQI